MKFITQALGEYMANCYIIYDEKTNNGFIIDPGANAPKLLDTILNKGLNIKFIILTHGHFDHTGAVNELKNKLKIPVYLNERDIYLVSKMNREQSLNLTPSDIIDIDMNLKEGDILEFGREKIHIIETPGHTPGGITVNIGSCLFTGDTLFAGSIGRTDFPGGSFDQIILSIQKKLLTFSDSTNVYPGHGPSTTIGCERASNPFLHE